MKPANYKQVAVIAETDPAVFENKTNCILSQIENPAIVFDHTRPLTVYILFNHLDDNRRGVEND